MGNNDPRVESDAVLRHYDHDSDNLIVCFGGIIGPGQESKFEFLTVSEHWPAKRLFLRDMTRSVYHGGLPGISRSVADTAEFLGAEIARVGPTRTVFVGHSGGGLSACLFGAWLDVDAVLAFAPAAGFHPVKSFVTRTANRTIIGVYLRMIRYGWRYGLYSNVPQTMKEMDWSTDISVLYSRDHRLDGAHAAAYGVLPNVRLFPCAGDDHQVSRRMRQAGILDDVIEAVVNNEDLLPVLQSGGFA